MSYTPSEAAPVQLALPSDYNDKRTKQMTLDETFKAAKAGDLTNDTTYKVGEISRKTGLQKQPDGSWAPPKGQTKSSGAGISKADEKKRLINVPGQTAAENLQQWENSAKTEARTLGENQVLLQNSMGDVVFYSEGDDEKIDQAESRGYKKMSLVRPDGSVKRHQTNNPASSEENSTMVHAKAMADNEQEKQDQGQAYLEMSVSGYSDQSLKQAASTYKRNLEEFDEDIESYLRRDLAPAQIAKRINSANFAKGALKAINAEIEARAKKNNPAASETKRKMKPESSNMGYDWSHGRYTEPKDLSNATPQDIAKELQTLNATGRLGRIKTKEGGSTHGKNYFNSTHGTFDIKKIDEEYVYIDNREGTWKVPLNEIEMIQGWHDYGKRDPETGEVTPLRPDPITDAAYTAESVNAPRENLERKLTGDSKIRIRK